MQIPEILHSLVIGEDLSRHVGLFVADENGNPKGTISPPNKELDRIPFPDYSDFPWSAYPNRMVPISTGRGCGWGVCMFCSDVTSSAGRTFRSRSPENVLAEIAHHHEHSQVSLFAFTDLKLNSNVTMWRAIISQIQSVAPDAKWIGSMHAGIDGDSGLSLPDLIAAANSGCVRLTTGLETGSQRLADLMRKGTRVESISRVLHDASQVGISCRCTMILGYPGETAVDLHASAAFLESHVGVIERVSLNRLQIIAGTRLDETLRRKPARFPGVKILDEEKAQALVSHQYAESENPIYRKAVMRLLTAVNQINSKDLSPRARAFDGAM